MEIQTFRRLTTFVFAAALLPEVAWARKFDFKTEHLATHVGGFYMPSSMSSKGFGQAAGQDISTDRKVNYNTGGEVGFVLSWEKFAIRLAGEYIMAQNLPDIKGTNVAGTKMFDLSARANAIVPYAAVELVLLSGTASRVFAGGGAGFAFAYLDNDFTMTTEGTAQLGVGTFSEKAAGNAGTWRLYGGAEFLLTDTVTFVLEGGYREMRISSLQATKSATAITGQQTVGGDLLNTDGTKRSLDFSGGYVGASLRFWIPL